MESNLRSYIAYRCVVGSRAYNLNDAESDTDRRGLYLPSAELHWSLDGVPEQLTSTTDEDIYWEAQKFVVLALKANPTVLECLYTPIVEYVTPIVQELLNLRSQLLSKLVYNAYSGYAASQFKKVQAEHHRGRNVNWKDHMHLIRLMLVGVAALREGHIVLQMDEHRESLLAIKRGEWTFGECSTWRDKLQHLLDEALLSTGLPEQPNVAIANDWLVCARRSMV